MTPEVPPMTVRIRLVTRDNRYVGTAAEVPAGIDVVAYDGGYYVPTGIEWFDAQGVCPVYRQADAAALLHCHVDHEDLSPHSP